MKAEFQNGWMSSCQDLSTYVNPKRGWFDTRPNRGQMIDHKILLDSYATQSLRTLASGLQSGMTSPSRDWFKLTTEDLSLDEVPGVRGWLDETEKRMKEVIRRSNIYGAFYNAYEELGQFGTQAFLIIPDFESIVRIRSYTAGEYFLSIDSRGRINGFAREFWMSVGQLIKEFGYENCSSQTQSQYKNNLPDSWVKVNHLIEENDTRIPNRKDFKNMPYRSAYWEDGGSDKFLDVRGFRRFPVIASRWETVTTDQIYGYGPGWYALGNIKQLQKTVLDKLIAQEKIHNPPMQQDASVDGSLNLLPGGVTKITGTVPNSGVRPAYQISPNLESFLELQNHLYQAIDKDFFVPLFQMLSYVEQGKMTATEVAARNQERLMLLGPVLYRIQEEILDPTMEIVFDDMMESGSIPQPPPQLSGMDLKVKYISILAQAQQSLGVEQIQRTIGYVGSISQASPGVIDIIDWDQSVREVGALEGAPAKLFLDKSQVAALREQRAAAAKAQQMAQGAAIAESASNTTKNLAQSPTDGNTALSTMIKQVQDKQK